MLANVCSQARHLEKKKSRAAAAAATVTITIVVFEITCSWCCHHTNELVRLSNKDYKLWKLIGLVQHLQGEPHTCTQHIL